MNPRQPVIVYVEDDKRDIQLVKIIVEKVMKWESIHILQSNANFLQEVQTLGVMPDLFLLDIQMKPYNGYELLSVVRSDPLYNNSKVAALTAGVLTEQVMRLQISGFDGAIAKPLDIDMFPKLIMDILNGESVWYIP